MERAAVPETRITPIPPRPKGVEIATIVSSAETMRCSPSRMASLVSVFLRRTLGLKLRLRLWRPIFVDEDLLANTNKIACHPVERQSRLRPDEHECEHQRHDHHHLRLCG